MHYFHLLPTPSCGSNSCYQNQHPFDIEGPKIRSRKANKFHWDAWFSCAVVERTLDLSKRTWKQSVMVVLTFFWNLRVLISKYPSLMELSWDEVWVSTLWPFKRNPQMYRNNSAGQDSLGKTVSSPGHEINTKEKLRKTQLESHLRKCLDLNDLEN